MDISRADKYKIVHHTKKNNPSITDAALAKQVGISESCVRNWLKKGMTPRGIRIEEERVATAKPVQKMLPGTQQRIADKVNNGSIDDENVEILRKTINKRNKLAVELLGNYYDLFPKLFEDIKEVEDLLRDGDMSDVERAAMWVKHNRMVADVIKELHAMGMPSLAPFAKGSLEGDSDQSMLDSGVKFIEEIRNRRNG